MRMLRDMTGPLHETSLIPAIAVVLALAASSPLALAQSTGAIEGTVVDPGGAPLPGVTVTLTGPLAPPGAFRVTGADGRFALMDVAAGSYMVTLALPGFEPREARATVPAGGTVSLEITLQIERLMESISVVAEEPRIFATNVVAEPMIAQQSTITSVLAVVDNLPGVSIQEGDTYGIDDWSTSISMRGFQVHLDEAQIGTTIDGFPNGTSDYWSGSKAHRFIDQPNMGGVEVSQETVDIASRSVEALGGSFHFTTDDPARERAGVRAQVVPLALELAQGRPLEPFQYASLANILDRVGAARKGVGDLLVGPLGSVRIGLQQNLCSADPLAAAVELPDRLSTDLAFLGGESNDVLLLGHESCLGSRPAFR